MNILNILSKKILNKFINFNELRVRIKIDLSLSHKLNIEPILRLLLSKIYRREYKKAIHQLNNMFRNYSSVENFAIDRV